MKQEAQDGDDVLCSDLEYLQNLMVLGVEVIFHEWCVRTMCLQSRVLDADK